MSKIKAYHEPGTAKTFALGTLLCHLSAEESDEREKKNYCSSFLLLLHLERNACSVKSTTDKGKTMQEFYHGKKIMGKRNNE